MSKGYQRADSLAEILAKRAEKQRQSPADRCRQIVDDSVRDETSRAAKYGTLAKPYQFKTTGTKLEVIEEKDLRKEIPGQLDIQDNKRVITKEMLDKIKDLPINKALIDHYNKTKKDKE